MKFEIRFERLYPHPPQKVWRALVDPAALGEWLRETDFAPETGPAFKMWCDDGAGGPDTYLCTLLDFDPPRRMVWSWALDGAARRDETFVEITVEPAPGGARVTVTHSGDLDPGASEKFKGGWPAKLDSLEAVLSAEPEN